MQLITINLFVQNEMYPKFSGRLNLKNKSI